MYRFVTTLLATHILADCRQERRSAEAEACKAGGEVVRRAIERGEPLLLLEYPPLPYPPGHGIYTDLLKQRCQVEWEVGQPGDRFVELFIEEVHGWNLIVGAEIRKRHGKMIMDDLYREARHIFNQESDKPETDPGFPRR